MEARLMADSGQGASLRDDAKHCTLRTKTSMVMGIVRARMGGYEWQRVQDLVN